MPFSKLNRYCCNDTESNGRLIVMIAPWMCVYICTIAISGAVWERARGSWYNVWCVWKIIGEGWRWWRSVFCAIFLFGVVAMVIVLSCSEGPHGSDQCYSGVGTDSAWCCGRVHILFCLVCCGLSWCKGCSKIQLRRILWWVLADAKFEFTFSSPI